MNYFDTVRVIDPASPYYGRVGVFVGVDGEWSDRMVAFRNFDRNHRTGIEIVRFRQDIKTPNLEVA